MTTDPMHIDNVRARRAADTAEQDMFRDIAREIDGPPPPGIGTLLKRALTSNRPEPTKAEIEDRMRLISRTIDRDERDRMWAALEQEMDEASEPYPTGGEGR